MAACRWFSSLTDGLRRAVGLLSSSTLPEAAEWSEDREKARVLEEGSQEGSGSKELLLEGMVSSPTSKAGREDWLSPEVAATWVCTVTSSGSPFLLIRGPWDVMLSM